MNTLKTGESLEILLYNPISTDDLAWIVGWTNIVSGSATATGNTANGVTNEGTAVEMIPAPTTGINQLTGLSVFNSSVNPYTVQIHKKISSNPVIIGRWTLAPGESLVYTDKTGFANNSTSAIIGTDEKVKYDVGDATAGYLTAKLAAAGTDTVADADTFNFYQVANTILKKITWANIVATIRTAFFGTISGILKADGSGGISAAIAADTDNDGYLTSADWDTFNGKQAALTFGIADTNKVQINAADVADNDYAKFTATGLEGRSYSEVLSDIGAQAALSSDINAALSGAASPSAGNVFATMDDVSGGQTADIQAALDGAASPSASNVFATMDDVGGSPGGAGEIWTALTGAYASASTFTFTGTDKDVNLIQYSLFTCTDSSGNKRRIGYVKSSSNTGGTITVTVVTDTDLITGDKDFKVAYNRKLFDYKHMISIPGEVIADASYSQGLWLLNLKGAMYLLPVDSAVLTAAAGAGAACVWNVYKGAVALFSVAPDLTTNATLVEQRPVKDGTSSTTRFDITNPAGTTFRYTFDGTGTDPGYSATFPNVGDTVVIAGQNFNAGNNGTFLVTASGANYFEVTNAGGVAENDKTIGTGEK